MVVTDINPYRLAMATAHGATRVVNVAEEQLAPVMTELGMAEGFLGSGYALGDGDRRIIDPAHTQF